MPQTTLAHATPEFGPPWIERTESIPELGHTVTCGGFSSTNTRFRIRLPLPQKLPRPADPATERWSRRERTAVRLHGERISIEAGDRWATYAIPTSIAG